MFENLVDVCKVFLLVVVIGFAGYGLIKALENMVELKEMLVILGLAGLTAIILVAFVTILTDLFY